MNERIATLLANQNLDYLMTTPEFSGARKKLTLMAQSLKNGESLSDRDGEYIDAVEKHIKNISPRVRKIYVNGEEVDCLFLTMAEA